MFLFIRILRFLSFYPSKMNFIHSCFFVYTSFRTAPTWTRLKLDMNKGGIMWIINGCYFILSCVLCENADHNRINLFIEDSTRAYCAGAVLSAGQSVVPKATGPYSLQLMTELGRKPSNKLDAEKILRNTYYERNLCYECPHRPHSDIEALTVSALLEIKPFRRWLGFSEALGGEPWPDNQHTY